MNEDFDQFKSYCALANRLIDAMDKEQLDMSATTCSTTCGWFCARSW